MRTCESQVDYPLQGKGHLDAKESWISAEYPQSLAGDLDPNLDGLLGLHDSAIRKGVWAKATRIWRCILTTLGIKYNQYQSILFSPWVSLSFLFEKIYRWWNKIYFFTIPPNLNCDSLRVIHVANKICVMQKWQGREKAELSSKEETPHELFKKSYWNSVSWVCLSATVTMLTV